MWLLVEVKHVNHSVLGLLLLHVRSCENAEVAVALRGASRISILPPSADRPSQEPICIFSLYSSVKMMRHALERSSSFFPAKEPLAVIHARVDQLDRLPSVDLLINHVARTSCTVASPLMRKSSVDVDSSTVVLNVIRLRRWWFLVAPSSTDDTTDVPAHNADHSDDSTYNGDPSLKVSHRAISSFDRK